MFKDSDLVDTVAQMIEATIKHTLPETYPKDLPFFLDLDLEVLGVRCYCSIGKLPDKIVFRDLMNTMSHTRRRFEKSTVISQTMTTVKGGLKYFSVLRQGISTLRSIGERA